MGTVHVSGRRRRWTRAGNYGAPRAGGWGAAARGSGPILWALPLAAFAGVLLADAGGGSGSNPGRAMPVDYPAVTEAELRKAKWPDSVEALDAQQPALAAPAVPFGVGRGTDREAARFAACGSGSRENCVVDGDTFWYRGEKIRIADINAPEVSEPQCPAEAALGARATRRLGELLNAGPFTLAADPTRTHDKYGRALFTVTRGGASLGDTLVAEGLAEEWRGWRRGWC